jgi:hypothetical protein
MAAAAVTFTAVVAAMFLALSSCQPVQQAADYLAADSPSRGRRVKGAHSRVAKRSAFADPGPGNRSAGTGGDEEGEGRDGLGQAEQPAPPGPGLRSPPWGSLHRLRNVASGCDN